MFIATVIRQKLHNYLEVANEKKLKAIYTIMEDEIEGTLVEYTNELKSELDSRNDDYLNGKTKMITPRESKTRIAKLMSKKDR